MIGLSLLGGAGVSMVAVIAIFLSTVPEGLSSSAGMKKSGRSVGYVIGIWIGIAVISGFASLLGYTLFGHYWPQVIAATTATAAGAILADTWVCVASGRTQRERISGGECGVVV